MKAVFIPLSNYKTKEMADMIIFMLRFIDPGEDFRLLEIDEPGSAEPSKHDMWRIGKEIELASEADVIVYPGWAYIDRAPIVCSLARAYGKELYTIGDLFAIVRDKFNNSAEEVVDLFEEARKNE